MFWKVDRKLIIIIIPRNTQSFHRLYDIICVFPFPFFGNETVEPKLHQEINDPSIFSWTTYKFCCFCNVLDGRVKIIVKLSNGKLFIVWKTLINWVTLSFFGMIEMPSLDFSIDSWIELSGNCLKNYVSSNFWVK